MVRANLRGPDLHRTRTGHTFGVPSSFGYMNYYSLNEASLRLCMPKGHTEDGYMLATIGFSLGKAMSLWIRMDVQHLWITSFYRNRWRKIRIEHAASEPPGT